MHKNLFAIALFIFTIGMCQEPTDKNIDALKPFLEQCKTIGDFCITKKKTAKITRWFEGTLTPNLKAKLDTLTTEIHQAKVPVSYYLAKMNDHPLIFSFHFYHKASKKEYGLLFIKFNNRKNVLVDELKVLTKTQLYSLNNKKNKASKPGSLIPPPPPPPPILPDQKN